MDFFKSVFSDDPEPQDLRENQRSVASSPKKIAEEGEEDMDQEVPLHEQDLSPSPSPSPNSVGGSAWSFGGFIKTFASKSESVLQTYRRDLEEFSSGLKKETAVIREVASRAVKELPVSLEAGASVAQESLESVGQAVDNFGSSVWRGTTEIISQGKDALLAADLENDSPEDSPNISNPNLSSKKYNRFEAQLHSIQTDSNTYCEDPEDLDNFNKWKSEFVLEDKVEEIENLLAGNEAMGGIYSKLIPRDVDHEIFWTRYFYRVHKLKQVEDARADLVKRAISGDEEEDLSWDVDDDDDGETTASDLKGDSSKSTELTKKDSLELVTEKKPVEVVVERGERSSRREFEIKDHGAESIGDYGSNEKSRVEGLTALSETNSNVLITKSDERLEGKAEAGESSKDSDLSIISSQPSLPEEEDLGWDEIEDLGSNDDKKVISGGSPKQADLRKRLSAADEDEDLSWDIEDDDEPIKP